MPGRGSKLTPSRSRLPHRHRAPIQCEWTHLDLTQLFSAIRSHRAHAPHVRAGLVHVIPDWCVYALLYTVHPLTRPLAAIAPTLVSHSSCRQPRTISYNRPSPPLHHARSDRLITPMSARPSIILPVRECCATPRRSPRLGSFQPPSSLLALFPSPSPRPVAFCFAPDHRARLCLYIFTKGVRHGGG